MIAGMSTGDRRRIREPQGDRPPDLILRLRLEPGDAVKGSLARDGDGDVVGFHGWIDFMAAIDRLRADAVAAAAAKVHGIP